MAKKKSLTQQIIEMSTGEIQTKSESELRRYYRALKTALGRRKSEFRKKDEISEAFEAYAKKVGQNPNVPLNKMKLGRLRREVAYLVSALSAKTSTLEGAREVHRLQDISIFGAIAGTNQPQRQMTPEERKIFWREFENWQRDERISSLALASSQEQSQLADLMFGGPVRRELFEPELKGTEAGLELVRLTDYSDAARGEALLNYLTTLKHEQEEREFMPNVYSGFGSNF